MYLVDRPSFGRHFATMEDRVKQATSATLLRALNDLLAFISPPAPARGRARRQGAEPEDPPRKPATDAVGDLLKKN